MKSVKVDCICEKIKFSLDKNYINELNKYNQVGLISIELYGSYISENQNQINELKNEILNLENEKKKAVEREDYDKAKENNLKIQENKKKIKNLEERGSITDSKISYNPINNNNNRQNLNNPKQKENSKKNNEIIDVDSQKVGNTINPLTFSQMVEKELQTNSQFSPYYGDGNEKNNNNNNDEFNEVKLDPDEESQAQKLLNFLPQNIVYPLYGKNSKLMEEKISLLLDDLKKYPNSSFFKSIEKNDIISTCSQISYKILQTSFIHPIISCIDILNNLVNKFPKNISNITIFFECIELSLNYLGDSNVKLKEKVDILILDYVKATNSSTKMINMIIKNPIKKNLMKSRNHYNGRFLMVNNLIKQYNYEPKSFEQLITYAVKGYAMNKINIRDAALEIIITLYKKEGDKIHEYFQKELRPAQIKTIEDKLEEINNNNNESDNEHTCEFCGMFDKKFNEDLLAIHQYRECPMLMQCPKCKQIIEICKSNSHLLYECDFKEQYKKCDRCKQAIEIEKFDEHKNNKVCDEVNEDKERICPLCHVNIEPEDIWKIHFLSQGCENNPRTKI